jgi:hypothetical protein
MLPEDPAGRDGFSTMPSLVPGHCPDDPPAWSDHVKIALPFH